MPATVYWTLVGQVRDPLRQLFTWFCVRDFAEIEGGIISQAAPALPERGPTLAQKDHLLCPLQGLAGSLTHRNLQAQNWSSGPSSLSIYIFCGGITSPKSLLKEGPARSIVQGPLCEPSSRLTMSSRHGTAPSAKDAYVGRVCTGQFLRRFHPCYSVTR